MAPIEFLPPISIAELRPSRPAPQPRPRGVSAVAAAASLAIAAAAFGSFVHMAGKSAVFVPPTMTVVEMADLQTPPPPPRPPPESKIEIDNPEPPRIVSPEPVVVTLDAVPTMPTVATATKTEVLTSPIGVAGPTVTAAVLPAQPADAGDLSAKMIFAKPPRYPLESRRLLEQGTVVLNVLLSAAGSVADISIARSSGFARLDSAAMGAVRRWRWSPTVRDGSPVLVRGMVTIPFVLRT